MSSAAVILQSYAPDADLPPLPEAVNPKNALRRPARPPNPGCVPSAPSNFFPSVAVAPAFTAMLDKIEPPRPYTWRSSADQTTDSGSESHPLMSSDTSRRSFGATCMFPDSETSDFEATAPTTQPTREPAPPAARTANSRQLASARRPFSYQNHQDQLADATYNRFHYYNKLRSYAPYEDSALMIPDHVIPLPVFIPFIPGQEYDMRKQSSLVTIFAVWNTVMGSSLLTMPWGVERAGFVTGIILMALMGGICLYTTYRLLEINKIHGAGIVDGEVADLCRMLLGRPAEIIAKFFSLIVLLGANIVYWILMSNFLYHSVDYVYERATEIPIEQLIINDNLSSSVLCPREKNNTITENVVDTNSIYSRIWNLNITVPVFLVLIMGPLVNFKSATFFTKFNSLGTLSVLYLVLFVLIKAINWGIHIDFTNVTSPSYAPSFLPSFPALSGMLALSFFIHNIIITIMRNNRNQENNGRDLSIAYFLVTITYTFIGAVFYISFPLKKSCISDNLLNNFQNWDIMTVAARMFLFFQLVTVFPLIAYMLRVQVMGILFKHSEPRFVNILTFNMIVITICVLFAVFLPRIGTIIRFTGALSGLIYIFTLPSLLHLASLRVRGELTWTSILIHLIIPIFGGGNLIAQFFVSE